MERSLLLNSQPLTSIFPLLDKWRDFQRLLNHRIADGFEFLILLQRNPLRKSVGIGAQHILPLLVPQIVQLPDILFPGKLRYDLVNNCFHVRLEVAINLLPGGVGEPVTKLKKQFFDQRIDMLPL